MMKQIYDELLQNYGSQGWWPVTPEGEFYPKYIGGPKTEKQKLEVIIGAILTQNTSWNNVEKAIYNLNRRGLFDIDKLIAINQEELASIIKSSGYFNQKAARVKSIALFLKKNPINRIEKMGIVEIRAMLLNISGIGPETADSIILYALNKPIFVIDGYTKRIFSRIGVVRKEIGYGELQQLFHEALKRSSILFNEYHALLVEHAKRYCRKSPVCTGCILANLCKKEI